MSEALDTPTPVLYTTLEGVGKDEFEEKRSVFIGHAAHVETEEEALELIHSGTAIANALSSYMTEFDLHRDYTHGTDYTRLMAAYVWYCRLLGIEQLEDIKQDTIPVKWFRSNTGLKDVVLTETEKNILIESVNNSLKKPFEITQSQYTEAPAK